MPLLLSLLLEVPGAVSLRGYPPSIPVASFCSLFAWCFGRSATTAGGFPLAHDHKLPLLVYELVSPLTLELDQ